MEKENIFKVMGHDDGGFVPGGVDDRTRSFFDPQLYPPPKPYQEPCEMCGSPEAKRKLFLKGEIRDFYKSGSSVFVTFSEEQIKKYWKVSQPENQPDERFVRVEATRHHIKHQCLCCEFIWHGKALKK